MEVNQQVILQEMEREQGRLNALVVAVEQSKGRIDAYNRIMQHLLAVQEPKDITGPQTKAEAIENHIDNEVLRAAAKAVYGQSPVSAATQHVADCICVVCEQNRDFDPDEAGRAGGLRDE